MECPPGAPPLGIVGNVIGSLFEQSFAREMSAGGRSTARQWAEALDGLRQNVMQCRANPSHWHLRGLSACPWCAMEAATGAMLFPIVVPHMPAGATINVDALWRQVLAVPHPGPPPGLAAPNVAPSTQARTLGRKRRLRARAGPVGAIIAVLAGLFTARWRGLS